jgi:sialidase-1
MIFALLTLCGAAFGSNASTVFEPKLGGIACFRIPSVVQTNKGTIIAFAEARLNSCNDGAVQAISTRRSTDGGKTWSTVKPAVGNSSYFVGNPSAVFTASGKVMLIYVKHDPKCEADCGTGNGLVISEDDGVTWGQPQDLSAMFGPASGSLPGPGTALQLTAGDKKGRLLVVSHHSAYVHDFVSYSDDDGQNWKTISQMFPSMDEAALTQLANGSVLLNMRHQASKTKGRGVAISHDNGETFGPIHFDPVLISPVCQASIVTIGTTTYFSNPASRTGRDHTTIRRSTDNAQTWSSSLLIEGGSSAGYSCLVAGELQSSKGMGGILYEAPGSTIKFKQFLL